MVPLAHGNDGGGSLRIPAACCGLVGLKPQRGRISLAPDVGEQFLVVDGVLTRTVRETALLLDVLAGMEPGDASWAPPAPEPFAVSAARGLESRPPRLRIGVTTLMPLLEADLHPACARAAHDAALLLEGLGHDVEEVQPPWQQPGLLELFTHAFGPAICSSIAAAAMLHGRAPREEDMEPLSWALWTRCREISAVQAVVAGYRLQALGRAVTTWAAPYDALLTPALAQPPLPIGELDPCGPDPLGTFERSGYFTPYTAISNVTGSPAISLPLYSARRRPAARGAAHRAPGAGGRAARAGGAGRGGGAVGGSRRAARALTDDAPGSPRDVRGHQIPGKIRGCITGAKQRWADLRSLASTRHPEEFTMPTITQPITDERTPARRRRRSKPDRRRFSSRAGQLLVAAVCLSLFTFGVGAAVAAPPSNDHFAGRAHLRAGRNRAGQQHRRHRAAR